MSRNQERVHVIKSTIFSFLCRGGAQSNFLCVNVPRVVSLHFHGAFGHMLRTSENHPRQTNLLRHDIMQNGEVLLSVASVENTVLDGQSEKFLLRYIYSSCTSLSRNQ